MTEHRLRHITRSQSCQPLTYTKEIKKKERDFVTVTQFRNSRHPVPESDRKKIWQAIDTLFTVTPGIRSKHLTGGDFMVQFRGSWVKMAEDGSYHDTRFCKKNLCYIYPVPIDLLPHHIKLQKLNF